MAGETVKSEAICLSVSPWSRTSHVVSWLTPSGTVSTSVKGAVRPKSAFLGQYDLNYTCELVYYARARGELHALRECCAVDRRDTLRTDYRSLAAAGYLRLLAGRLAPQGPECGQWYSALVAALDVLAERRADPAARRRAALSAIVSFELETLHLMGLSPEIEADSGAFAMRGERQMPVSREVADHLRAACARQRRAGLADGTVPLDALRAVGVYYNFHVGCAPEARRSVLRLVQT